MSEPFLKCPPSWARISLEASPADEYILKVSSGGTPSTTNEDFWDGDIPWLTPKEITQDNGSIYVSHTERNITQDGVRGSGAKLLPPNTVMLTKRAPVGAVAVNTVPMATNQGFMNFVCGPKLRPLFLAYWFIANRPYLDAVANGSTYPELYLTDLFEFEVAVPPLPVQDKILETLQSVRLLSLLGQPLQQAVTEPEQLLPIHERNRRLLALHDQLLPLLISGALEM